MTLYYVDKRSRLDGDHEVHRSGCSFMPEERHRMRLGDHLSCHAAVSEARRHFERITGCVWCSPACYGDRAA